MPGNGYGYSIIPLNYYCDGNSIKTADETSTYFPLTLICLTLKFTTSLAGDDVLAVGYHLCLICQLKRMGTTIILKEKDACLGFTTGKPVNGLDYLQ